MESLMILIVAAIIIQFLVERVKDLFPTSAYEKMTKYVKPSVISLVFSLLIAFCCKIDIFNMLGFAIEPVWVSYILTAVALSGGAVGINELIKALSGIKENYSSSSNNLPTYELVSPLLGEIDETDEDTEETSKDVCETEKDCENESTEE